MLIAQTSIHPGIWEYATSLYSILKAKLVECWNAGMPECDCSETKPHKCSSCSLDTRFSRKSSGAPTTCRRFKCCSKSRISLHFEILFSSNIMGLWQALCQRRPGSPSHDSCNIELQRHCNSNKVNQTVHQGQVQPISNDTRVTEQSLQVWRALPAEIRHDPSMASFRMENERIYGEGECREQFEPVGED